jgi:nucleoside-diphosphate-sugar epimerase
MKIVVTGCNGRLGSACAETLLAAGHVVVGIDCAPAPDRPHEVIVENLLNPYAIHRAIERLGGQADAVVHLANHINSLVGAAEVVLRENQAMNTSVFMGAWQAGAQRVVFASSVQAMLGGAETDGSANLRLPARLPIDETIVATPTNVYGLSKILAERTLDSLCDPEAFRPRTPGITPMSAVSLRLPYILAPKAFDANVARTGQTDFMWGGSEAFAYIAREDAAEAIRLALEAELRGHHVLWVAAPDPRTPETVDELIERFYSGVPGVEAARAAGSFMNCARAERTLGWRASRILREERRRQSSGGGARRD